MLMLVAWFALSNHCVLGASRASAAPVGGRLSDAHEIFGQHARETKGEQPRYASAAKLCAR